MAWCMLQNMAITGYNVSNHRHSTTTINSNAALFVVFEYNTTIIMIELINHCFVNDVFVSYFSHIGEGVNPEC